MWDKIFIEYVTFLLIFVRIMAVILLNPFTGRKNIPVILKAGLSFLLAIIINSVTTPYPFEFAGFPQFFFAALKEMMIGFSMVLIMHMFMGIISLAGEMIDVQIGLGMSRIYDPASNSSLSFSGNLFNIMFFITFFACDGHLTLIKVISLSFQAVPVGFQGLATGLGGYLLSLFANTIILGFKITLPIIAAQIVLELAQGILMRSIPQINVFAVGVQLKLLLGFVLLIVLLPTLAGLFNSLSSRMFEELEKSFSLWT